MRYSTTTILYMGQSIFFLFFVFMNIYTSIFGLYPFSTPNVTQYLYVCIHSSYLKHKTHLHLNIYSNAFLNEHIAKEKKNLFDFEIDIRRSSFKR